MQAIETVYQNYHFRSRLEARWAVFFDALGLQWEYEVEGFVLSTGEKYLPDFKVTSPQRFTAWYDIKPVGNGPCDKLKQMERDFNAKPKTEHEEYAASFVSFQTLEGDPHECIVEAKPRNISCSPGYTVMDRLSICPRCGTIAYHDIDESNDGAYFNCYDCDLDTPCGGGNPEEKGVIVPVSPHKGLLHVNYFDYRHYLSKINEAARAARSARFEHGQSGATI